MKAAIAVAALALLAGCAGSSATTSSSHSDIAAGTVCRGTPSQGHRGMVTELGVDTSPVSVGRGVIEDRMDVQFPGWLNMTASWGAAQGSVDLQVKQPGKPDQVIATPPFELRLHDPSLGEYSLTLQPHPVAYGVSFDQHIRYNYTVEIHSGSCPGVL